MDIIKRVVKCEQLRKGRGYGVEQELLGRIKQMNDKINLLYTTPIIFNLLTTNPSSSQSSKTLAITSACV